MIVGLISFLPTRCFLVDDLLQNVVKESKLYLFFEVTKKITKHHRHVHSGDERPFQCPICEKIYASLSNLLVHVRTHSGAKSNACSFCPRAFKSISNWVIHERRHYQDKPFKCSKCDELFAYRIALSAHQSVHDINECLLEGRTFKCDLCSKNFSTSKILAQHQHCKHTTRDELLGTNGARHKISAVFGKPAFATTS